MLCGVVVAKKEKEKKNRWKGRGKDEVGKRKEKAYVKSADLFRKCSSLLVLVYTVFFCCIATVST